MKRFLAIALCLVFAVFASCGKPESDENTAGDPAKETEVTTGEQQKEPENEPPKQVEETPSAPENIPITISKGNMPRLDGSTATRPLAQYLAATLLGLPMEECGEYSQFSGTSDAYYNLVDKQADLLLVYEPPVNTYEWIDGDETLEMAPIGKDALVFLVNAINSVDSLTHEQIIEIYTNEAANWQDVGGKDVEIAAYQRNEYSGSQTLMEKLVMQGAQMARPPEHYTIEEMAGLITAVASFDGQSHGIGYNVYYFVSQMAPNPDIKMLAINGVAPTSESIKSGDYPYVNDFYAVIRKDAPEDSIERLIFNWLQTADGQALVETAGYVGAGSIEE